MYAKKIYINIYFCLSWPFSLVKLLFWIYLEKSFREFSTGKLGYSIKPIKIGLGCVVAV